MAGLNPPTGHSWSDYDRSLYETSETEPDQTDKVNHCLEDKGIARIRAIWFDQVMSDWTALPARLANHLPATRRIDAYYVCGEKKYLIEFKRDGDLTKFKKDLWLKFHDSLTQLIDHGWISLQDAQKNLTYIVVRTGLAKRYRDADFTKEGFKKLSEPEKQQVLITGGARPMSDLVLRPWRFAVLPDCDLGCFEGVSCQKVLTINVVQFDRYGKESHWT